MYLGLSSVWLTHQSGEKEKVSSTDLEGVLWSREKGGAFLQALLTLDSMQNKRPSTPLTTKPTLVTSLDFK